MVSGDYLIRWLIFIDRPESLLGAHLLRMLIVWSRLLRVLIINQQNRRTQPLYGRDRLVRTQPLKKEHAVVFQRVCNQVYPAENLGAFD